MILLSAEPATRVATGEPASAPTTTDMTGLRALFASRPDFDSLTYEEMHSYNEACEKIAAGFAAFLEGHNLTRSDEILGRLIEELKMADRPYELKDLLEQFYGWADDMRVWLEQ